MQTRAVAEKWQAYLEYAAKLLMHTWEVKHFECDANKKKRVDIAFLTFELK